MLTRRTILLKPMRAAASGYARLQSENGRVYVQLHARGLEEGEKRLFATLHGKAAAELASGRVNANGEFSLEGELEEPPKSLLLLGTEGAVLIGLCEKQDAGALMEARNAALALADRLSRPSRPRPEPPPAPLPRKRFALPELPREIFLPAIDPAPYQEAAARHQPTPKPAPMLPPPRPAGPAADRLKPLRWPAGFETLADFFSRAMPVALFDAAGWRFVQAADGLWIGRLARDGRVIRLAYACRGRTPPPVNGRFHPVKGLDGEWYQVMWQNP